MNSEQTQKLRQLLDAQTIAALGTLQAGEPFVSMVPFALLAGGIFVIHVSALAAHTKNMLNSPRVSLLVMAPVTPDTTPQALARVTIQGDAERLAASSEGLLAAREAYLMRFPQVSDTVDSHDFSFFAVRPSTVRFVGGFGQAFTLRPEVLAGVLARP